MTAKILPFKPKGTKSPEGKPVPPPEEKKKVKS